ncbi:hypothetical protein AALO_G00241330 [Alosa alosa]|uniref:Uncharacterized protein n=1 Tax=Alosa alosa TaxID=278164 RepID=A0AAV6FRD7_9TELE|nr:hypothetical protein AALO_G00241330 [Alosa alosa]
MAGPGQDPARTWQDMAGKSAMLAQSGAEGAVIYHQCFRRTTKMHRNGDKTTIMCSRILSCHQHHHHQQAGSRPVRYPEAGLRGWAPS